MRELCKPDIRNKLWNITPKSLEKSLGKVTVSPKVPDKIITMLDFAKKICIYGYYEYEFYSLSLIYLSLLTETSIKERFLIELPKKCTFVKNNKKKIINKDYKNIFKYLLKGWTIKGFESVGRSLPSILEWLLENGILPNRINDFKAKAFKDLRNSSAHLEKLYIHNPAEVIPLFWEVIDFINCLFDTKAHTEKPEAVKNVEEDYEKVYENFEKIKDNNIKNPNS